MPGPSGKKHVSYMYMYITVFMKNTALRDISVTFYLIVQHYTFCQTWLHWSKLQFEELDVHVGICVQVVYSSAWIAFLYLKVLQ